MKKIITMLAVIGVQVACHSSPPATAARPGSPSANSTVPGAADALGAVRAFMAAVKQQDLQALGAIWGDANGPARDAISRDELEKRELIMLKCLRYDRYEVVADAPSEAGSRTIAVKVEYKTLSPAANFTVVRGPAGRWYVQNVDLEQLQKICAAE